MIAYNIIIIIITVVVVAAAAALSNAYKPNASKQ